MFWKNWSWAKRILFGAGLGLVGIVFYPAFVRSRERPGGHRSCISNLKMVGLGVLQYAQDYDEHFPLVKTGGSAFGWADSLQPYLKSTQLYQCPLEPNAGQANPHLADYTDYWFNEQFAQRETLSLEDQALIVMCAEGRDGADLTNARYSYSQPPLNWNTDANSPFSRHDGKAYYLFADGHVKPFSPGVVSNGGTSFSFRLPKPSRP